MNATILNRKNEHPADGWYQVEVPGEHPAISDNGTPVVQVIDGKAVDSIVATFNREAGDYEAKNGQPFPGMLLDREHFSHDETKETAADGWVKSLRVQNGAPEAQIDFSTRGKAAVDGREYKFFSTEYEPEDLENLGKDNQGRLRVRPLRLAGLSLTNRPNNKGGRPITNRKPTSPDAPAARPAGEQADTQKNDKMSKIATKLGLSAEASEDAILDEIGKLVEKAKANQEKEKETTGLKNRIKELEDEQIGADLDAAGIKNEAAAQLKPYLGTLQNREARQAFLKTIRPAEAKQPLTVKNRAKTPGGNPTMDEAGAQNTATDGARAIRIRNRAAELRNASHGRISVPASYTQATAQVDAEIAAAK